jgi:hypothetical protein
MEEKIMTEIDNIAKSIYNEEVGANEWSADDSLLGSRPIDERPGHDFQPEVIPFKENPGDPGEVLYQGRIEEGDPPGEGGYESHIDELFSSQEREARIAHDDKQLESLAVGRKNLEAVLKDFSVGDSGAKSLMLTARFYTENPMSPEQIAAANIVTSNALKAKWGGDYDKMLSGAKRVLSEAARKVPGMMDMVNNSGLGSDEKTIIQLAHVARRRGYLK